jgi:internalin A
MNNAALNSLVLSVVAVLSCCWAVMVNPAITFVDPALEAAVRAEVFAKRRNQEPITIDDVKYISRLVGPSKGIKSLVGLEHFADLMLIDLGKNEITDLTPIANLKKLQSVTLAHNKLVDLKPLENLTAMQLLDVSGNQVSDLTPLSGMSNLRTLYVANNQLTTLQPISALTKIWSLDASQNQIADLSPLAKLTWLTSLNVDQNKVTTLQPLESLEDLDLLILSKNQVSDFGPLLSMCEKDATGERKFAPYLDVYLDGNPIDDKQKSELTQTLNGFGVDVNRQ